MASPSFTDAIYDGGLLALAAAVRVDICHTEPTTYGQATTTGTYSVGNYTITAGSGGGDWLIAAGDVSGRKLTLLAQTGNNGTATGTGSFLAFTDNSSILYGVIDGDGDTVNSGSPVDIAEVDVWEITATA